MKRRIFHKLLLAVALPTALAFALFATYMINCHHDQLIEQVRDGLDELSETVKSGTKEDMLNKTRDRVHRTIETIAEQPGIEKVRIFNKEGEIIFSSDKTEMKEMVDKQAEACYACHAANKPIERLAINRRTRTFTDADGIDHLGIINPIYNEPGCSTDDCHGHMDDQAVLGVLDMTMSLEEIQKRLRHGQVRMAALSGGVLLMLGILLWFLVKRLIGSPVERLVRATNAVAEGDLDHKVDVKSAKDELSFLASSFNDMTERLSKAQEQIYQQDKLASLGRMSAGVAHELNNPLTGVLTYGSFLIKRIEDEEARADLEVIVREAKRCREIVKGLLDFARQNPSRKRNISINEVIRRSLEILVNELQLSHIKLEEKLNDQLPQVYADPGQMQQVMVNIIVNAVDAMKPEGGLLTICTGVNAEGKVEIRIRDTGCGMTREQVGRVFEPFYSTKGLKGTGLGLAVVWGIVDDHKGTIAIDSKPGEGTEFLIRLDPATAATAIKEGYDSLM